MSDVPSLPLPPYMWTGLDTDAAAPVGDLSPAFFSAIVCLHANGRSVTVRGATDAVHRVLPVDAFMKAYLLAYDNAPSLTAPLEIGDVEGHAHAHACECARDADIAGAVALARTLQQRRVWSAIKTLNVLAHFYARVPLRAWWPVVFEAACDIDPSSKHRIRVKEFAAEMHAATLYVVLQTLPLCALKRVQEYTQTWRATLCKRLCAAAVDAAHNREPWRTPLRRVRVAMTLRRCARLGFFSPKRDVRMLTVALCAFGAEATAALAEARALLSQCD